MSVGWATGREILSRDVKQSEGARGCQGSDEGLAPGTSFPGESLELHTTAQAAKENTAMHATQNYVNGTAGW